MNALSRLFETLHLSRRETAFRRSHRRRRTRQQRSFLSCETLEPKQLLAADLAAPISADPVQVTDAPVAISLEGKFEDNEVFGTVVKFETNAPLSDNDFYVELTDNTPLTNENFLSYVNSGAYDNSFFHRSITNFVIQGGGFTAPTVAANEPNSDPVAIVSEDPVRNEPGNPNTRGTIAMAKVAGQPDSATSQFFFNLSDNNLDSSGNPGGGLDADNGGFTQFGSVLGSGMTVVDTMGLALTFNAEGYYANTTFTDLPLFNWRADGEGNVGRDGTEDLFVQPNDFVKIENVDVVTESDLFTYSFSGFDTNKLTVSESNGNIVLTPVGNATGTFNVTVTATSKLDNTTASDTFSVQLNGGGPVEPPPVLTAIEEAGDVKLQSDGSNRLYADNTPIYVGSTHITFDTYATYGYTQAAVETIDGVNQLVLVRSDGYLWKWSLDSSWTRQATEFLAVDSTDFYEAESAFVIDGNQDGFNGAPPVLTTIESDGGLTLAKDASGRLFAGTTPIYVGSTHITFDTYATYGYTQAAVETIDGVNQLVLVRSDGYLWKWSLDSSWTRQATEFIEGNTPDYYDIEFKFQSDLNEDLALGQVLDGAGDATLTADGSNRLYADNTPIYVGSTHITFDTYATYGYTQAAVETIDGVNQLVLVRSDGYLWKWSLDSSWTRQATEFIEGNTPDYYDIEFKFQSDLNEDLALGQVLDGAGDATLTADGSNRLYADNTPIYVGSTHITFDTYAKVMWVDPT